MSGATRPPVIVLEDDPLIAAFMSKALRKSGHVVECFDRGLAVLERVQGDPSALLLLDLGLPDIDGLEVLRRLRASGSTMPVIVVTSRSDPGDRVEALTLGVAGYVVKPFPLAELLASVEAAVAAIPPAGSVAGAPGPTAPTGPGGPSAPPGLNR
ncbi:response regulator transcription factor [Humibacillus xanthopallidus]|uniref:response regulator transcription factor n=1 Tax=Humibacillus xanthopallidus TaxID=412689 RepID=UPI003850D4BF